jgi:hypothetical protein
MKSSKSVKMGGSAVKSGKRTDIVARASGAMFVVFTATSRSLKLIHLAFAG